MPGTLLSMGETITLTVSFNPLLPGDYASTLTFETDQGASIGTPGQSFNFQLTGTAAVSTPEPGSLGLLATCLAGIAMLRRRLRPSRSR